MDRKQVENLGEKIQRLRKDKGLSQDELARKADIPYTTLTKIEIGVIKKPSVFAVAKIAEALDITLDDLVFPVIQ
ncbi:MAG: helix-turn-helix transcriptional regulator [Candidatus Gracilibacteria bacterium]